MAKELAFQRWSRIMEDHVRSGLCAKEYCLQEGIGLSCFLNRRKELRNHIKDRISVEVADFAGQEWPADASLRFDGVSVTFEALLPDTLRKVLSVARSCRQAKAWDLPDE